MVGWVALHRSIRESPIYHDENLFKLFLSLLIKAEYRSGIDLKVGQLQSTCKDLSLLTGLSNQQVKTNLKKLVTLGVITIKSTNKNSLLTVIKWDVYQRNLTKTNHQNKHQGWIKISRILLDSPIYQNNNLFRVFIHFLLKATHKNFKAYLNGIIVPTKPGQFLSGRKVLARELNLTEQEIRTAIKKLAINDSIIIKTSNRFTLFTITNWDIYQIDNQQITNKQPTSNQPATTYKKTKNIKKEIESLVAKFTDGNTINYPNINSLNGDERKLLKQAYSRNLLSPEQLAILETKGCERLSINKEVHLAKNSNFEL